MFHKSYWSFWCIYFIYLCCVLYYWNYVWTMKSHVISIWFLVMHTQAKFVHAHIYCAAWVWDDAVWTWNRPCACVGIRNSPSVSIFLVPVAWCNEKGHCRFRHHSSLRHTQWQVEEGRVPKSLGTLYCHYVHLIFDTWVVLVIMIYYILSMC